MADISAVDKERLTHINLLMEEFYTHTTNIYEHLVDRDIPECKKEVDGLILKLKDLRKSLEDDV